MVLTSELTEVEFASAVSAASRAGRLSAPDATMARFYRDAGPDRLIAIIALRPRAIIARAVELVRGQRLRSLDAIHLAVALEDAFVLAGDEPLELVTRDHDQAAAARALGLTVRP